MSDSTFGANFGAGGEGAASSSMDAPQLPPSAPTASAPAAAPQQSSPPLFGSNLTLGPSYRAPNPQDTALDQTADTLQQRIQRANSVATNPILQFFNPEGVAAARNFVPQATEQLQKIRAQKADMQANAVQAQTLGLNPGEVPDEASMADRVAVAQQKALNGDLRVFKGLQAVDPKSAEAIQDKVHEAVAGHLTNAQLAFDSLAGMTNQGQYQAKLNQLRQDGTLTDLEALGLKVPKDFDGFNATKAQEGRALREARIGVDTIRQKLEERNTYQPMEEKEAKTYNGRLTTAYGDQITNGTWARNGAAGTRGLVVNGAADPRDLGKNFTLATPDQRKAIKEEFDGAVPKEDIEKYRAFNRTYQMAVTGPDGKPLPAGQINTNPNVQQGIAEGLASTLRGGQGGANIGLLKLETNKRGYMQGLLDSITSNYAGGLNAISGKDVRPYLTKLTQSQVRDVMDYLHAYNEGNIGDRMSQIGQRAGALGLDPAALGLGRGEAGGVGDAIEQGRQAQIARMMPNHQAIGGGDGVLQLSAQRPGVGAILPPGQPTTTQLPGARPLTTPVQAATNPSASDLRSVVTPPAAPNQPVAPTPGGSGPAGGGSPTAPITIAGQQVSSPALPPGASPNYLPAVQRIESGNEKSPWTAGTARSSASGAFQFINSTWAADKPPGAPARAADATPQQQTEAAVTRANKNARSLTAAGLPVNDTNLYVAHNLGEGAGPALLKADPNADARAIVGEDAAKNNPKFFRGRPTVATVLGRYAAAMSGPETAAPATAEPPGLMTRISRMLSQGIPGGPQAQDQAVGQVGQAATENAPAIGSTLGAIGGSIAGPLGAVGGGAAGGGAGQALKDYLQGNKQNPTEIAKQTALGGVLGVASEARPVLAAGARVLGVGGTEAASKAVEGGDAADITQAGLEGAGAAVGGEAFGRALGMVGHKVWNLFAPDAKKAVQGAAKTYAEAQEALKTEPTKLPGVGGAAGTNNPKYEAAQKASDAAERTLKDAGLNPEEAAYAHKVSSEGVPLQEAQVAKPGELEKQRLGKGYQDLEQEVKEYDIWGNLKKPTGGRVPQSTVLENDATDAYGPRQGQSRMPIRDATGKQVGAIDYSAWPGENAVRIKYPQVEVNSQGKSLGVDAYTKVADSALAQGKQVWSDRAVTTQASQIYDALERRGYSVERNPNVRKLSDSTISTDGKPLYKITAGPKASEGSTLSDGPMAAVNNGKVSAQHSELAQRAEAAVTAPAKSWQDKWTQLQEARSDLLGAERDALTSTATGRTQTAKDMRTLADTIRTQQEKTANYVFGPKDGPAFVQRLKMLDARYRNLMEATNGGDLARAATMTGEAGREVDRKFRAFAHDDPTALAAWNAMRGAAGKTGNVEKDVRTLVGVEKIPYLGKAVSMAKMLGSFNEWMRNRAAASPAKFSDFINMTDDSGRRVRDVAGTVAQRAAAGAQQ